MEYPVNEAGLRFLFTYVANATFRELVDATQPNEKLTDRGVSDAMAILPRLSAPAYDAASLREAPLDGNTIRLKVRINNRPQSQPPHVKFFVHDTVQLREVFIAIWIIIFAFLTMYLLGMFKLAHDSDLKYVSVCCVCKVSFALSSVSGS